MAKLDLSLLGPGNTLLVLSSGVVRHGERLLPSPVLYVSAISNSAFADGMSSDVFKRRVVDVDGLEHRINDATLVRYYRRVAGEEERTLRLLFTTALD